MTPGSRPTGAGGTPPGPARSSRPWSARPWWSLAPTPQQWCCLTWLVSSSPHALSGLMSPPRPVTLAGTHSHVPGPDHTCPGSGVPAAAVLAGPDPGQGPPGTGAQLASYAGLAPVTRRSGSSIRGEVRLPRRQQEAQARHVPLRLRLTALRPRLPGLLPEQTRPRQTALGQAILALAHRRILTLHAMIRDGALYDPQPATKLPAAA